MHALAERLARMLLGNVEQAAADAHFDTTEACTDGLIVRLAHPALSGVEPARIYT